MRNLYALHTPFVLLLSLCILKLPSHWWLLFKDTIVWGEAGFIRMQL